MAIALVRVPHDVGRLFNDIPVPGEKENEGDLHITLVYFEDPSTDDLFEIAKVIHNVVKNTNGPIPIMVDTLTSFPPDPTTGVAPVVGKVFSEPLVALRRRIVQALDAKGLHYSKKHPDFKPHVTLSYSSAPDLQLQVPQEKAIPLLAWSCAEIYLWGGSWGDHSLSVCFPLRYSLAPPPPVTPQEEVSLRSALASFFGSVLGLRGPCYGPNGF